MVRIELSPDAHSKKMNLGRKELAISAHIALRTDIGIDVTALLPLSERER